MSDPKATAARLTVAQRKALTSGHPLPSMGPYGYDTFILGFEHGRSAKALHHMGLATLPFAPQILTPLGLAVRTELEKDR